MINMLFCVETNNVFPFIITYIVEIAIHDDQTFPNLMFYHILSSYITKC